MNASAKKMTGLVPENGLPHLVGSNRSIGRTEALPTWTERRRSEEKRDGHPLVEGDGCPT